MKYLSPRASLKGVGGDVYGRHTRAPYSLPLFAFTAALTLVLVLIFTPDQVQVAVAASAPVGHLQSVEVNGSYTATIARDGYGVTKKLIAASTPAASVPAGEAQLIAYNMLISMGMGDDQFSCLVSLWNKESHWSTTAGNPVSGAYGIPQALPGSKMASAGPDWQTNATTQITWGLGYINGRYGSPCGAWAHSEASNWY